MELKLSENNIVIKNKHKYIGLNSRLVDYILKNKINNIRIFSPKNNVLKKIDLNFFKKKHFESEKIKNKFENNEYTIQYFKIY